MFKTITILLCSRQFFHVQNFEHSFQNYVIRNSFLEKCFHLTHTSKTLNHLFSSLAIFHMCVYFVFFGTQKSVPCYSYSTVNSVAERFLLEQHLWNCHCDENKMLLEYMFFSTIYSNKLNRLKKQLERLEIYGIFY